MTEGIANERATVGRTKARVEQLSRQRERLEHLRPLFAQASASLLHGIIVQSRTVPSMTARIGDEPVPLDAEEDIDSNDIVEGV
jgi:hypothetical protein